MTSLRPIFVTALMLLLACLAGPAAAQERTLDWDALDVTARLDADGRLYVTERHTMVFDGEWNGGERTFQLREWQSLELDTFAEIDSRTGVARPWIPGDLKNIGEYRYENDVLRWRVRMPDDPPLRQEVRIYAITYVMEGVLYPRDGKYVLEHDLAFPNRDGVIRRFSAKLDIDPTWQGLDSPMTVEGENLLPGESSFVYGELEYTGTGEPQAVGKPVLPAPAATQPLRHGLLMGVLGFLLLQLLVVWLRERASGRYAPHVPLDSIDETWLATHLLGMPPEEVGAAWDLETSASEVAALLARMTQEGKLRSSVSRKRSFFGWREVLSLELLSARHTLAAHERALIDALFVSGGNKTDTDSVRKFYQSQRTGFDPATLVRPFIEKRLGFVFAKRRRTPWWMIVFSAIMVLNGVALTMYGSVIAFDRFPWGIPTLALLFFCYLFALGFAASYSRNVHELPSRLVRVLLFLGIIVGVFTTALEYPGLELTSFAVVGLALLTCGFINSCCNRMRPRDSQESLQLRRVLGSARHFFIQQLRQPQPQLKDEWFPYLIAFGLGPKVDRWFKAYGAPGTSRYPSTAGASTSHGSSGSWSGSSTPPWTGGGGTFGGAGASGTWAAAAAGMAAGVAAPSSSGSGSSSSSGGSSSSSGGGGGGGW